RNEGPHVPDDPVSASPFLATAHSRRPEPGGPVLAAGRCRERTDVRLVRRPERARPGRREEASAVSAASCTSTNSPPPHEPQFPNPTRAGPPRLPLPSTPRRTIA